MTDPPITEWLDSIKRGDCHAETQLWNHYFSQVVRLARSRMFALQGAVYDEEDAAVSAMRSVFLGLQHERFPELHDRHNFWRILVVITRRKLRAQWRRETASRRSPKSFDSTDPEFRIEELIADQPTPAFVAEMMDETERLMEKLGDEKLRKIMVLRLDGMTVAEIATRLDCTTRTIERKLGRIRVIWGVTEGE